MKTPLLLAVLTFPAVALAGPRTSPNYDILADVLDAGGGRTNSATYQEIGSAGLLSGLSSAPSTLELKSGYVAQLNFDGKGAPLEVISAASRKTHGAAGVFDINLPLSGPAGIECRAAGPGGNHQVIVTFATPVSASGVSVMSSDGQASGAFTVSNSVVTVDLTGVANRQTIGISLLQVSNGSNTADIFVPMSVLLGDTNGSGAVSSSDIGQTKAQSGQAVTGANFRNDVNVSGSVSSSDIGQVKANSGSTLP